MAVNDADVYRAERARALLQDDLLGELFTEVKMDALSALAECDATNLAEILRLQAVANCLQSVKDKLEAAITRTGARDGGLSMTATRKANTATN